LHFVAPLQSICVSTKCHCYGLIVLDAGEVVAADVETEQLAAHPLLRLTRLMLLHEEIGMVARYYVAAKLNT